MCENNKECNKDDFGNDVAGTWELTVSNPIQPPAFFNCSFHDYCQSH